MKQKQWIVLFLIGLSVFACKENRKRAEAENIIKEWMGKEIRFPGNVPCYVTGKDTLSELCSANFQKEFKILLYVDSTGYYRCWIVFACC